MSDVLNFEYEPSSEVITEFHLNDARRRFIRGPVGSGKTTACIIEVWRNMTEVQEPDKNGIRKSRYLIVRNTQVDLIGTTLKAWKELLGQYGNIVMSPLIQQTFSVALRDNTFVNSEVIFYGLDREDQLKRILSAEYTGVFFNEAREMRKSIVDLMDSRIGRYPAKRDGGATRPFMILDFNPPQKGSWIHKLWEENSKYGLDGYEFFAQPPGMFKQPDGKYLENPLADNIENLPDDYYPDLVSGKSDDWISVYICNEFGAIFTGEPIYSNFSPQLHVQDELKVLKGFPVYFGVDWGTTPAIVGGQYDVTNGQFWVNFEWHSRFGSAKDVAETIKRTMATRYQGCPIGKITGDPAGNQHSQTDGNTPFLLMKKEGVEVVPAHTNDLMIRIATVQDMLAELYRGKPKIVFDREYCEWIIDACRGGYHYKKVEHAGKPEPEFKGEPDKNEYSHSADALQYLLMGLGVGADMKRRDDTPVAHTGPRGRAKVKSPLNRR